MATGCNIENRDITWCVPCIDPSYDRIIVQKRLSRKNNTDFNFYEKRHFFYKNVPDATCSLNLSYISLFVFIF